MDNYRPIALMSVFSKIIEKVMYDRVINFLNKESLLNKCQHGFRDGFSTETATAAFTQKIHELLDKNNIVVAIFFHLSRAFDTIHISFISQKIYNIGIRGPLNEWFQSFLSHREIMVKIDNVYSDSKNINIGTPQGSVLGPLIFLL